MAETPFDQPSTAAGTATIRRDAMRTMGAAGMALLAMLALLRFHMNLLATLGLCAAAGLAVRLLGLP